MLLFSNFTAKPWQVTTYLLGVTMFSINFLVFMNSAVSFVITDVVGQITDVGKAAGDLGFADELIALVACPFWGMMSDRIGVRTVSVTGYAIIGISLFVFVQARNVYPQLLLGRILFSVGGAAASTMVTAILPVMTLPLPKARRRSSHSHGPSGSPRASIGAPPPLPAPVAKRSGSSRSATSQTAGLVGMFSGLGALLALSVFLPLPTAFAELMRGSSSHDSAARATSFAFYTVGLVALLVALACFFGLRNLAGEEPKGLHNIIARNEHSRMQLSGFEAPPARFRFTVLALGNSHLAQALRLGGTDASIGLGYLGGFVARASSVAISLFIPLFVNVYFIRTGQCHNSHSGTSPGDIKRQCRRAYALAAMLSGVSQLVALLCAPLFGYLDGRVRSQARSRWWRHAPLLGAAACGVVGYVAFARLASPAPGSEAGSGLVFLVVALLGVSQIGAIVCSLSLLSRGIQGAAAAEGEVDAHLSSPGAPHERGRGGGEVERAEHEAATEESALLPHARSHHDADAIDQASSRAHLKGSIAGVYSLAGGAGILLLTKLGGQLFDGTSPGAPFYMMAAFNGVLLAVGLGAGGVEELRARRKGPAMA